MFKYFIKDKEVNKQNFQNKVGDYITVLSGDTVSSTLFNSFFAEYEARVTNKDNNKLINRNNPMELNEHLKEVMNKVKLEDRLVDFDGMEYYAVGMGFVPKMREGERQPNNLVDLIEIIKQRDSAEKDKTEKLVFTTLEKELTSEKQQGHLSTRHKKPAPMYLDEAIAEIAAKKLETEKNKHDKLHKICMNKVSKLLEKELQINPFVRLDYTDPDNPKVIYAKKIKTKKTLVDLFDKIDPKEYNTDYTQKEIDRVSSIAMESLQRPIDSNFSRTTYQENLKIGIKNNKNKPSLDIVINKQFPNALQLIALATEYGHNKYAEKDKMYDNFRNVEGGSQTYFDAAARHNTDRNGVDNESGLPHIIHASWDFLAGLELWTEENNINIKDFSENYMKNLNLENAK